MTAVFVKYQNVAFCGQTFYRVFVEFLVKQCSFREVWGLLDNRVFEKSPKKILKRRQIWWVYSTDLVLSCIRCLIYRSTDISTHRYYQPIFDFKSGLVEPAKF